MAEKICLKNKALIFRTNFFGKSISKNKSFTDWIFRSFKMKKKIYLFDDVYFNPLRIDTIVNIISKIVNKRKYKSSGIYNLGTKDALYKNEFGFFAKKTSIFHKNYVNIKVNKLLNVKRSKNMYMCTINLKNLIIIYQVLDQKLKEAKGYINERN